MPAELRLESDEPALLAHLLLVNDGTSQNGALERELVEAGFLVTTAHDAEHALELLVDVHPDLLVRGTAVLQTAECRLRRVTQTPPSSPPPPLPGNALPGSADGQSSCTASPRLDLGPILEQVERMVRTSLLPPPLGEFESDEVA